MSDIIEEWGQVATLKKAQDPTIDATGNATGKTYTDVTITIVMQPLSGQEMERHSSGRIEKGTKKVYAKPTYTQSGTDYEIDEGDIIVDWNSKKWRVERLMYSGDMGETAVYRKWMVRRVV